MGKVREILEKYMWEYAKQEPTYCEVDINKYVNQALTQLKALLLEALPKERKVNLEDFTTSAFLDEGYNQTLKEVREKIEDIFNPKEVKG